MIHSLAKGFACQQKKKQKDELWPTFRLISMHRRS